MKLNLKLAQRLFLCAAPFVTGSVLTALPGSAATLAGSGAEFTLSNFSHNPVDTSTFTDTKTLTISSVSEPEASDGLDDAESYALIGPSVQVVATANAVSTFPVASLPELTQASNVTYSLAQGDAEGTGASYSYLGIAESTAQFVGYNFNVGAGETFSFDVAGLFGLYTSRDNVITETTSAFSNISFLLYDTSDLKNPLDFFTFSALLDNPSAEAANPVNNFLSFAGSENSNFQPEQVAFNASFGEKEQSVFGFVQGTFSRFFDKFTSLMLVGVKSNEASVSCKAVW
jgi:hypothetical protein